MASTGNRQKVAAVGGRQDGDRHACAKGEVLAARVRADQLDEALTAGLMDFRPCPSCDPEVAALLLTRQQRFLAAWSARDRYREREARLRRLADERARPVAGSADRPAGEALPPAAASALARAKARAGVAPKP